METVDNQPLISYFARIFRRLRSGYILSYDFS